MSDKAGKRSRQALTLTHRPSQTMEATTANHTEYEITANGVSYGVYEAADEEEALDAMLKDAGYGSRNAIPEHIDPSDFEVREA